MHERSPIVLFVLVSLVAASVLAPQALAATPTASPTATPQATPTSSPNSFPYRLIVTGPSESFEGEVIQYRVRYESVDSSVSNGGFVFDYDHTGAELTAVRPASADVGPFASGNSENIAIAGSSGEVEFDIKPLPGFVGKQGVGVYVRGTNIVMPPGTVSSVVTDVRRRATLPATGNGSSSTGHFAVGTARVVLAAVIAAVALTSFMVSHHKSVS